jgi:Na+-driven multidrug efflux pump
MIRCTIITACIMGVLGALLAIFPGPITRLLTDEPVHLEYTPHLLLIAGVVQIPFGIGIVLRGAMRGAGDVRVVALLTWFTTYALRLPLAYFFSGVDIPLPESMGGVLHNPFPYDWGLTGLWIGLCTELILRGVLFSARFLHGGWARQKV